jgi:hypothetical protein
MSDFGAFFFDGAQVELGGIPIEATGPAPTSHTLVGSGSSQANSSSVASAAQRHTLAGSTGSQGNASSTGAITQRHKVAGATTSQSATSAAAAIVQKHVLAGIGTSQSAVSGTASLGEQPHILSGSTSSQGNASTSGAIVQRHRPAGAASTQDATSTSAAITQRHLVAGAATVQSNTSSTGTTAPPPIEPDARYARPLSAISAGPWLPSTGTDLAAMIDEPSADSADYISTTTPGAVEIALGPVVDPGTSANQVLRYQIWSTTGSGGIMRLKQGSTVIAYWPHEVLPATPTIYVQALTGPECDSITDYTDLRFEFTAV